jgi:hypothetical protein
MSGLNTSPRVARAGRRRHGSPAQQLLALCYKRSSSLLRRTIHPATNRPVALLQTAVQPATKGGRRCYGTTAALLQTARRYERRRLLLQVRPAVIARSKQPLLQTSVAAAPSAARFCCKVECKPLLLQTSPAGATNGGRRCYQRRPPMLQGGRMGTAAISHGGSCRR